MKLLSGFLIVLVLGFLGITIGMEGFGALLLGWIPFLYRVLPAMEVDWPNLTLGVGASLLLAIGIQWLASWWRRSRSDDASAGHWKLRWTLMLVVTVVLLFAAGLSVIGIFHQASWLLNSEPPMFEEVVAYYGDRLYRVGEISSGIQTCGFQKKLPQTTFSQNGSMLHSWETDLLPYMTISTQGIDKNRPWYDPCNQKYFKCIIPMFINPDLGAARTEDDQGYGLSHYAANEHVIGGNKSMTLEEITDGTANTLLLGEVNANFAQWANPVNWRDPALGINRSPSGFGGPANAGGALFVNADGSVRFVSDRISPAVLRALSTPCGKDHTAFE